MDPLLHRLLQNNIQPSHQRLKILEMILDSKDHPNVSSLYEKLVREIPTISRTTVYNTLNAFLEKGLITYLTISPEEVRYDSRVDPHHHLICRKCRKIIDIDICCQYSQKQVFEGHCIEEVHGYFRGICRDCLNNNNTTKKEV